MEATHVSTSSASPAGTVTTTTALVETFLSDRNPHTLAAFRHDLQDFARFVGVDTLAAGAGLLLAHGYEAANGLTLAYKTHLIGRELSAATVNRRLGTLRNLIAFAKTAGIVSWKLTVANQKVHAPGNTPGPGRCEVEAVLTMIEERGTPIASRDRAIIRLLYDLALRRAEIVALDREHLDLEAGTLTILGHGDSAGEPIALPKPTKDALSAWLAVRGDRPGPLFSNFAHGREGEGRLVDRNLYAMIRRHGQAIGVHLRPHGLRRTAITQALALMDGDVAAVQQFSRHKSIRTVKNYNVRRMVQAGEVTR